MRLFFVNEFVNLFQAMAIHSYLSHSETMSYFTESILRLLSWRKREALLTEVISHAAVWNAVCEEVSSCHGVTQAAESSRASDS